MILFSVSCLASEFSVTLSTGHYVDTTSCWTVNPILDETYSAFAIPACICLEGIVFVSKAIVNLYHFQLHLVLVCTFLEFFL